MDTSNVDPQKTLRKMDLRLIPMLALLYLLSFLDRGNIGNAKIAGMQKDLSLSGRKFAAFPKFLLVELECRTAQISVGNGRKNASAFTASCPDRTTDQYSLCATVFFFTYCVFEIPSNLLLKRLRPSVWLPSIMVAWGTVMTLMGLVNSYHGLLIARIFLGVAEAGLYPGGRFSSKLESVCPECFETHLTLPGWRCRQAILVEILTSP